MAYSMSSANDDLADINKVLCKVGVTRKLVVRQVKGQFGLYWDTGGFIIARPSPKELIGEASLFAIGQIDHNLPKVG